jgi:bifunctional DNA-binding transcriptional regulator/antitoxin component of YhaV-PrlF toxin-antitoxin module
MIRTELVYELGSSMKAFAQIESDGRLTIAAEVVRAAGLGPGDRVEMERFGGGLLVAAERSLDDVFARYAGTDRSRPPMSIDEIVAEQRETRGHDDLEISGNGDLD